MKHCWQMPRNLDWDEGVSRQLTHTASNSDKDMYFFKSICQHQEEHIQGFLESWDPVSWTAWGRGRECSYLYEEISTAYSEVKDRGVAKEGICMLVVCFCCLWPRILLKTNRQTNKTPREQARGVVRNGQPGSDHSLGSMHPKEFLWATLVQEHKTWGKMCSEGKEIKGPENKYQKIKTKIGMGFKLEIIAQIEMDKSIKRFWLVFPAPHISISQQVLWHRSQWLRVSLMPESVC